MRRLIETTYTYAVVDGEQKFRIEVWQDETGYVGRGFSSSGAPITGDVRVSFEAEKLSRIDGIPMVAGAVQGLIIQLIHAHSTNPTLRQ